MAKAVIELTYPAVEEGDLNISSSLPQEMGSQIRNKLEAYLAGRSVGGALRVSRNETSGVAATATATFTAVVATDKLTVAGVDFTCVASGATGNQFNKGASEAASATNCAARINANTTVNKYVTASVVGAVITLTANVKCYLGNLVTVAETGGHMTLSAAALAGGVDIAYVTYTV